MDWITLWWLATTAAATTVCVIIGRIILVVLWRAAMLYAPRIREEVRRERERRWPTVGHLMAVSIVYGGGR